LFHLLLQTLYTKKLSIKLTDEVINTHPVQETQSDNDPSARSVSEHEAIPQPVTVRNQQIKRSVPFYETAKADLLEAIKAHEQSIQNVKGSLTHEAFSLLFENNLRSFYKIQETLVQLGKVYQS